MKNSDPERSVTDLAVRVFDSKLTHSWTILSSTTEPATNTTFQNPAFAQTSRTYLIFDWFSTLQLIIIHSNSFSNFTNVYGFHKKIDLIWNSTWHKFLNSSNDNSVSSFLSNLIILSSRKPNDGSNPKSNRSIDGSLSTIYL